MSILEEVLLEERERSQRISNALERELASLPRGSIRAKQRGAKTYYYLQYRDGNTVRSEYVRATDIEELRRRLARRKEIVDALREQERTRKRIEKALKGSTYE